jgi:hypothetical protein
VLAVKRTFILLCLLSCLAIAATPQTSNADIVGIGVQAIGTEYEGPCPVMVHFKATIYLTRVPVKLTYYWQRGNGKTRAKNVEVSAEGLPKVNVSDDFAVGASGKSFKATDRLHVSTAAGEVVSDTAESTGRCRQ